MLRILGRPTSINVRKVLWLCDEIGLAYLLESCGTASLPVDTTAFKGLNPNATVPVIVDGEFVLWESNTICRYLAAAHDRTDLLPALPSDRARVEQWMDWQAAELNRSWSHAFMALVRGSAAHTDPAAIAAGLANWNRHMAILDGQLRSQRGFVLDDRFTLADVVLGLSTHRWFMTPMDRPALPAVTAYYERLSERPAFLRHGRNGQP